MSELLPEGVLQELKCALKRLSEGGIQQTDISLIQQALSSGQVLASGGGVAVGGNVSNSMIVTFQLSPDILKLLHPPYIPPEPPNPNKLQERGNLPPGSRLPFYANAVFTGREEDLLMLAKILLYTDTGGVGVTQAATVTTGFGGFGKSQLAVEFCYRYGRFFQGVHWIQADQDISAEVAACGLAMALPGWPDTIQEQVALTLKAWQEGKSRQIVLDNVEDLEVIQDWMPRMPNCRLLITSQRSEWPADIGINIWPLDVLGRSQSTELLRKLAPRLDEVPDQEVRAIAERLGDLPLALDLAGRYMADRPELSPEGYLVELGKAGSALEHISLKDWVEHSPTKHATNVAATFALSWDRLAEDEIGVIAKQIFKTCGYCAPNIPIPRDLLAGALDLCGQEQKLDNSLRKLFSFGLLIPTERGPSMHVLLAEFARLQDKERGLLAALAEALVDLSSYAISYGIPKQMISLREHLRIVARFAEALGLIKAGTLWNNLGCILRSLAEYKDALRCSVKAIILDKRYYDLNHPMIAIRFNNLGLDLKYLCRPKGAKKCLTKAIEIDKAFYGPSHPIIAGPLNNLGGVLEDLDDKSDAKKNFEMALKIGEAGFGPNHPNIAIYISNIGRIMKDQGDLLGAKKCLIKAFKIDRIAYGPDHPQVAKRLNNLGTTLDDLIYPFGAKRCFLKALIINEKYYGLDHLEVAHNLNNLGMVMLDLGEFENAKNYIGRSLKIYEDRLGNNHTLTKNARRNLIFCDNQQKYYSSISMKVLQGMELVNHRENVHIIKSLL